LGAPVITCFGIFTGRNRYELFFELIAENLGEDRRKRAEAITKGMHYYVNRLEYFARCYPYNWFNFYDFWQNDSTQNDCAQRH